MKSQLLFLMITILFTGCMSRNKAFKKYRSVKEKQQTFDAAIVPGLAIKTKKWGIFMKYRVIWAAFLYNEGIVKNIIFSGGAVYTPYYEAYIMGLYAKKLGVPERNIFYDTIAKHSSENVYYAYLIAQEQGFKKVALCSDRFQTTFLKLFLKRRFPGCIYKMPVVKDTVDKYDFEPEIDMEQAGVPNPAAFRSYRKTEPFKSRLRGTLGKRIPWDSIKLRDCRQDTNGMMLVDREK